MEVVQEGQPGASGATMAVAAQLTMPETIDVSAHAHQALMFGAVYMEAEAFGVAVTRRTDASADNLTMAERARLLDVLLHARDVQADCIGARRTFSVWTVSSDARDNQARMLWLSMTDEGGAFVIRLSLA